MMLIFFKNSFFCVMGNQNIAFLAHIFGPLTLDPFIKKIEIAAKAQPGLVQQFDAQKSDKNLTRN